MHRILSRAFRRFFQKIRQKFADISMESRTVDMHIRTLRKKLGDAGKYICTVRKVGYKLTDEEEAGEE